MTKETIYQNFLEDPLLVEKGYITAEKLAKLKMVDPTGIKLLEVIKAAINGSVDGESEGVITRRINQFLNR